MATGGDDGAGCAAYELLQIHGRQQDAATQKEALRALEAVMATTPRERQSADALRRLHVEEYVRLRCKEAQEAPTQVSERRTRLRSKCRERWKEGTESATIEDARERFPKLFQGIERRSEHGGNWREEMHQPTSGHVTPDHPPMDTGFEKSPSVVLQAPVAAPVPSRMEVGRAGSNARHRIEMDSSTEPPHIPNFPSYSPSPVQEQPQRQPQPGLADLLRKKPRQPYDDMDMDDNSTRPDPGRRNPFQTAAQRLQHDRLTGRARNTNDDQEHGRQGHRRNPRGSGPPRGVYHPVNQNVLLGGGGRQDGDDDTYGPSAVTKKFVSPMGGGGDKKQPGNGPAAFGDEEDVDPRLKSCDPELIEKIEMEIVDSGDPVGFDDIAGLQFAKKCVNELVIWPMARPDIFTGLRTLPKGLLLFGPPGTGKTLIGKAIANQSGATFFNISASSLTSKWIGQGEKLVRTLFAVAAVKQPSVIFIDEIDSLLTQRSSEENEASRRMKTEFLVQLDGAGTKAKDVILVVGATNRPQELDEAARRRFVKRLYIPLPSLDARLEMINRLLKSNRHELSDESKSFIAESTKGYSGADVRALCTEAAMGPIRSCTDIRTMDADSVRAINLDDFKDALRGVRTSVATKDLAFYKEWNDEFGSFAFQSHEG